MSRPVSPAATKVMVKDDIQVMPSSAGTPRSSSRPSTVMPTTFTDRSDDRYNEDQGNVKIHRIASSGPSYKLHQKDLNRERGYLNEQSKPSSWARNIQQRRYASTTRNVWPNQSFSSAPPHVVTETMSNLAQMQRTHESDEEANLAYEGLSLPPDLEDAASKSSFKGWLTEGLLELLNTAAGFTIATTGTILSPPIELTKKFILPGTLAIVIDTLDNVIPPRIQDWFRILTSSVYHLCSVLKSTESGKRFRLQLCLVVQNLLEAWSSTEFRQVVIDGLATGVKFADALHTPEMEVFLEQTSVLCCRLVDAISSGKTKQLIQNGKNLAWQGIELAVDPRTTLALAEVTAHFCHALEELNDSFPTTPRSIRNLQNESTYVQPLQMTNYQSVSIETTILSSLGINGGESCGFFNDIEHDSNEDISVHSVPSNVEFLDSSILSVANDTRHDNDNPDRFTSTWAQCKGKVNVELLQKSILQQGRAKARSLFVPSSAKTSDIKVNTDLLPSPSRDLSMESLEVEGRTSRQATNFRHETKPKPIVPTDLIDRLRQKRLDKESDPMESEFSSLVNDLLAEKQERKKQELQRIDGNCLQDSTIGSDYQYKRRAKVKRFRSGSVTEEVKSKDIRKRYSSLRRMSKCPHFVIYSLAAFLVCFCLVWFCFGVYGVYTFYQGLRNRGASTYGSLHPQHSLCDRQQQRFLLTSDVKPHRQNTDEIVIRIVNEATPVHRDGERLSKRDLEVILQCVTEQ